MVKIFVGNLASSTTEEELRNLFSQYGKISECDILKNYGFVHMNSQSEAEEAIRNLHHHELNGEAMNVEMSKRRPKSTTKLHVSNIPDGVTGEALKTKFEEYGPVAECDIVKDYAFVHMECVEDAMEAISKLDNTAFQGKLLSVQLSTSRLRTAPGMGDQTGCFVCGKQGHWSKDCPIGQNGSYGDGPGGGPMRGRGRGRGFPPRGPPGFGRGGGYGMPGPSDYMLAYGGGAGYPGGIPPPPPIGRRPGYGSAGEYGGRAVGSYPERSSAYGERERYGSVDYYEKYRARPYGSSYFEERRLSYIPPPPPPSSLSRLSSSSLDPYERRPMPPVSAAAAAAAYYARDRSPIRRVPVASESYTYERSRLSPGSSSRSATYTVARARDPYADAARYATY